MAKKLYSFRALSCTLAVLVTLIFIFACGQGGLEDVESLNSVDTATGRLLDDDGEKIRQIYEAYSSDESEESSSSGEDGDGEDGSSSSGGGGGGEDGSSSSKGSSSAQSSSSSEEEPSSSSESPYKVECKIVNTEFPEGVKIPIDKRPELKCIEKANTSNVIKLHSDNDVGAWENDPPWSSPEKGKYDNIIVTIERDDKNAPCHKVKAKCDGTVTITGDAPKPSSASTTQSSTGSGGSQSSSSRANSSSAAASSSSAASSGGEYCYYSPASCHKMPTNDNCKDGVLVSSCSNPGVKFCDYGVCESPTSDGYGCGKGGCYVKKSGSCDEGGSEVSSCATNHLPPASRPSSSSTGSSGGGNSSSSRGTSSSSGGGGGGSGTIALSASTSNLEKSAGTYTVTVSGVSQCSINCGASACSLSGAIAGSGTSNNYVGNLQVKAGSVTITGIVKFSNCW